MIRAARWLPLSLAIHAAAAGGGVWLGRDFGEPALFVDMRLIESDVPPVRAKSPRAGSPAPPAAPAGRRPAARSAPAAAPARESAAAPPVAPAPPIVAAPPVAAEPPTAAPPVTHAPSAAPAPSLTPEPSIASVPPPVDAPVADAPASPSGAQSFIAGETPAASDGGRGAASATSSVGNARTGGEGTAASATRGGTSADGPLALAIPGDGGVGVYGPYLSALRRRLQEALEYPAAARRRGLSGTVHLEVVLDATGRVSEVLLARSSSHAVLDDAALEAARRLPRVPFPPDVRPRPLRVLMPVDFQLR